MLSLCKLKIQFQHYCTTECFYTELLPNYTCSGGLYDNSRTLLEPCVMLLESFCLTLEIERFHMGISNMRQNHQSIYSEKTTQRGFFPDGEIVLVNTAHIEWCVTETFSITCDIEDCEGCPVVTDQWSRTGCTNQVSWS